MVSRSTSRVLTGQDSGSETDLDEKRTLVVGADTSVCYSVNWHDIGRINLVDYDRIILIARHFDRLLANIQLQTVTAVKDRIARVMKSGGEVILVTPRPQSFMAHRPNGHQIEIGLTAFLPVDVSFVSESGSTLVPVDGVGFKSYLNSVKRWDYWINPSQGTQEHPMLRNREGKTVAGVLKSAVGPILILPDLPDLTVDQIAAQLLTECGVEGVDAEAPPPWAEELEMPGLLELKDSEAALLSKIKNAQDESIPIHPEHS